jgi:hypothetical protein
MEKFKEQIVVETLTLTLDCDITRIVDLDGTNDPAEIHVWLDDVDIKNLTADNNYRNIAEQMALVSSAVRPKVDEIAGSYDIEITCECFGVANGKMYILYFGVCK